MKVNILGEKWDLVEHKEAEDPKLNGCDGYADTSIRRCVVDDMTVCANDPTCKGDLEAYKKQVKRHELIHAFLFESGLDGESWAKNEEMVDFFAIQFPKLARLFSEAHVDD